MTDKAAMRLVPVEPTDEMIRTSLAIERPATYRDHLRHPDAGPKTAAETEALIERERKRWSAMLAAAPAQPSASEREAIARIIDPFAAECRDKIIQGVKVWEEKHGKRYEFWANRWEVNCKFGWEKALAKADRILATRPTSAGVEAATIERDKQAWLTTVGLVNAAGGQLAVLPEHVADAPQQELITFDDPITGAKIFRVRTAIRSLSASGDRAEGGGK